jgi:hypothetical protein
MLGHGFREAIATKDAGADPRNHRTQPANVCVAGKQFQRGIEASSGLEQKRKDAREYGDVLGAGPIEKSKAELGSTAVLNGNRLDGNKTEVFNPLVYLSGRRGRDGAADDFASLTKCSIVEGWHGVTLARRLEAPPLER